MLRFYDSHNHLQDARLAPFMDTILAGLAPAAIARVVVNGTREEDWRAVAGLARREPRVLPSFGLHPWHIGTRSIEWQSALLRCVESHPAGAIGEIGLDRWIEGHDLPRQEEVFVWQWRLAVERNLPVSIHCLRAWGRLIEILRSEPRSERGFLLHSYGGSREMIGPLADLGAYFSVSGHFAHPRKAARLEVFRHIPKERLLIETDAPDMTPPPDCNTHPLRDQSGREINHPANLLPIYRFVSGFLDEPLDVLAERVARNFHRLFGGGSDGESEE